MSRNEANFAVLAGRYHEKFNEIATKKIVFDNAYSPTKQALYLEIAVFVYLCAIASHIALQNKIQ
ncbi:MAG: hypothetical protein EAZ95_05465 [Bacteroidetes bacterium]|nr:MAG: hypothetical protein EAZ95_05465 [Bacteroidota bacterium]